MGIAANISPAPSNTQPAAPMMHVDFHHPVVQLLDLEGSFWSAVGTIEQRIRFRARAKNLGSALPKFGT